MQCIYSKTCTKKNPNYSVPNYFEGGRKCFHGTYNKGYQCKYQVTLKSDEFCSIHKCSNCSKGRNSVDNPVDDGCWYGVIDNNWIKTHKKYCNGCKCSQKDCSNFGNNCYQLAPDYQGLPIPAIPMPIRRCFMHTQQCPICSEFVDSGKTTCGKHPCQLVGCNKQIICSGTQFCPSHQNQQPVQQFPQPTQQFPQPTQQFPQPPQYGR